MTTPTKVNPLRDGFDFTDPDLLQQHGMPVKEFAELRRTAPVWWNAQPEGTSGFTDGGFWVISKHTHIREISKNNQLWSTNAKGAIRACPTT